MSYTYEIGDQTTPEPLRREVHRDSFHKTSLGYTVETVVIELEHPTLLTLTLSKVTEDWEAYALEYLTAIVALRLSEGWVPLTINEHGAFLTRQAREPAA